MATHTWTTVGDIPPAKWAAMCAEMRTLLTVTATGAGATVTGPAGTGDPILDGDRIAFCVTTAGGPPVVVDFPRTAGTGTVATSSAVTGGLVLLALRRAVRNFAALLPEANVVSDADREAAAFAQALEEGLFGADDRAVIGLTVAPAAEQVLTDLLVAAGRRVTGSGAPTGRGVLELLDAVAAELAAERSGRALAAQLLTPAPNTPQVSVAARAWFA